MVSTRAVAIWRVLVVALLVGVVLQGVWGAQTHAHGEAPAAQAGGDAGHSVEDDDASGVAAQEGVQRVAVGAGSGAQEVVGTRIDLEERKVHMFRIEEALDAIGKLEAARATRARLVPNTPAQGQRPRHARQRERTQAGRQPPEGGAGVRAPRAGTRGALAVQGAAADEAVQVDLDRVTAPRVRKRKRNVVLIPFRRADVATLFHFVRLWDTHTPCTHPLSGSHRAHLVFLHSRPLATRSGAVRMQVNKLREHVDRAPWRQCFESVSVLELGAVPATDDDDVETWRTLDRMFAAAIKTFSSPANVKFPDVSTLTWVSPSCVPTKADWLERIEEGAWDLERAPATWFRSAGLHGDGAVGRSGMFAIGALGEVSEYFADLLRPSTWADDTAPLLTRMLDRVHQPDEADVRAHFDGAWPAIVHHSRAHPRTGDPQMVLSCPTAITAE